MVWKILFSIQWVKRLVGVCEYVMEGEGGHRCVCESVYEGDV